MDSAQYEIIEGMALKKVDPAARLTLKKEDIKKFFKDKVYTKAHDVVIQALYFYPYLTKYNISRYADHKLKDQKWNDYSNLLKKMWQDGVVERLQYGKLNLYRLSDGARQFGLDKFKNLKGRDFIFPNESVAAVLESASLAQWHISLICGESVTRAHFYENIYLGEMPIYMPSYAEFKKNGYKYHVSSFCLPKEENNLEDFLLEIKALNRALRSGVKASRKEIYINVIVCTTLAQIEYTAAAMRAMKDMKELAFYFVLDENTVLTKGLEFLYWYTVDEEDSKIKTVRLN